MKIMRSLLQTPFWADFKSRHGWMIHETVDSFVLERQLPFGQRFLYAPELTFAKDGNFAAQLAQFQTLAKERGAFVMRLEFLEEYHPELADQMLQYGLVKSFEEIQPEFRQWIDLAPDTEAILAQMKQKGRYNIRLAEKHGVTVKPAADINIFLKLFTETAKRDGFSTRQASYYKDLLDTLHSNDAGELLVAWHNQTPLAAAIMSTYDGLSTYLYGASSSDNRELMAPYFLHWTAMQRAKANDCHTYDLLAIAPFTSESQIANSEQKDELKEPRNPKIQNSKFKIQSTKYAGITRFKQQFGGRAVHLLGSWDLRIRPVVYSLFKFAEQRRRR